MTDQERTDQTTTDETPTRRTAAVPAYLSDEPGFVEDAGPIVDNAIDNSHVDTATEQRDANR